MPEKPFSPQNTLSLIALAVAAFAIGTAEFVTTGLLPNIAQAFHIHIPTAGYVTSSYAFAIVIGGPVMTALTIRLNRKKVLCALMALFILGMIVSAIAPSFGFLIAGRMLAGVSHGAFFGISAIVAGSFVAPEKKATAIALMFTGLTFANVIGVPFGTLLGHHFSWRIVMWVVGAIGLMGLIGMLSFIPSHINIPATHIKKELHAFKQPMLWSAFAVTALGFGGLLAIFAYIAPLMIHVAGFNPGSISWIMMVFGIGLVIGNIIGGKLADKSLSKTLYGMLTALIVTMAIFSYTSHMQIPAIITLLLLGIIGFGVIPALQAQVMIYAKEASTLSSSCNISAFNLGVTISVYLAGLSIHYGLGYANIAWVGSGISTCGLIVAILSHLIRKI